MADDDFTKAEPSRWHTGTPGHAPSYSGHKLRKLAAAGRGEIQSHAIAVAKLFRTEAENRTGPQPRHVVTLEDVTRGLGLDSADAMRIQGLVHNTSPTFTQKMQTQRIFHARGRLLSVMRDSMAHVPSDAREEVLRRAVGYWKRHHQTDYGKSPTVRFGGDATRKSMEPIPVLTVDALLSKAESADERAARLVKKYGLEGVNKPKMTPGGDKKAVVVAKEGGQAKLIRFGDPDYGHNISPGRRAAFKARHAKDIASGKMSAAYWADRFLWSKGGRSKKSAEKGAAAKSMLLLADVDPLEKGAARGGKYYRRVPKPGGGYRYYYTKAAYDKAHGGSGHLHGPEQLSLFNGGDKGKPKPKANTEPKRPEETHTKAPAEVTPQSAMIRAQVAYQHYSRVGDASKLRDLAQDTPTLKALQRFASENRNRPKQLAKVRRIMTALRVVAKPVGEPGAPAKRTSAGFMGAPPGGWTAADRVPPRNAAEARNRASGVLGGKLSQLEKEGFEAVAAPRGMQTTTSEALGPLAGAKVQQLLDEGVTLVKRPQAKQEGLESTGVPQQAMARQDGPKDGAGGRVLTDDMKSQLASVRPRQEILVDGTPHRVERLIGGNRDFGGQLQTMTLHLKTKSGRKATLTVPAGSSEARYSTSAQSAGEPASVAFPEPEAPPADVPTGSLRSMSPEQMVGKWTRGGGASPWHLKHGPGGEQLPAMDSFKTKREATENARAMVAVWHAQRDLPLPEGLEDRAESYAKWRGVYQERGFLDTPTAIQKPDATTTAKLQAVGTVPAKSASDLQPGDSMAFNYGSTATVQKVRKVSPKFFEITWADDETGKEYKRRTRADRITPLNPDKHRMFKSFVRAAYEPLLGRYPRFVVRG